MIKEDYVSFEIAKLLKEKGFTELCRYYYLSSGNIHRVYGLKDRNCASVNTFSAPTLQMAMKWLRGKGIECVVIPIWNTIGKQYRSYVLSDLGDKYKDNYDSYSDNISYEGAVEAALKYCLENLI